MTRQFDLAGPVRVVALAAALAFSCGTHAAAPAAKSSQAQGGVSASTLLHVNARIVDIDTETNSVLLEGPSGNDLSVTVSPEIGDVGKLKVGDKVEIAYQNALLVRAEKVASNGIRERIDTDATTPVSGGETTSVRSVEIVATVEKIDRKKRLVTLRGPSRTEVFRAPPEISIDSLKVGDSVRAQFVSAAAVQITRDGTPVK
jgi:Cu/Ag efflux protein CusF